MTEQNFIQTFQIEDSGLKGRLIKLDSVLNNVLTAHGYPYPIAHMVGETMTLSLLLSSMIKYDGIFTFQAKGDGPVSMLLSDVTNDGIVRGCATFDPDRFQHAREQLSALKTPEGSQNHLAQYLGKGYMAFTVEQGNGIPPHQGLVELRGSSLVDCVQHYLSRTENIGTGIKMAVGLRDETWHAGAVMLQHMPEEEQNTSAGNRNLEEDPWRRAMILLDTCTEDELLDSNLSSDTLLHHLFHEDGVRVFTPKTVQKGCRCNRDKVKNIISLMSEEDRAYMAQDNGTISMRCEFCSKDYLFDLKNQSDFVGIKT